MTALEKYFELVDSQDRQGLDDLFAEDAMLVRPAVAPDGSLHTDLSVVAGRAAIVDFLIAPRLAGVHHEIRNVVADGATEFVEGFLSGVRAPGRAFLATASVDATGRIVRYFGISVDTSSSGLEALAQ